MSMHGIWTPLLFLLCFCPLLLSAAPGVAPPTSAGSQHVAPIVPATATAANSSSPNCTDLSATTGVLNWTCWDTLGMNQYMFNWNYTAEACKSGELWSTCFLRVAYGSDGYDCSRLGSLNCTAPRLGGPVKDAQIFYGAQNIYAMNQYFTTWTTAIYALKSQPAISAMALTLSRPGLPRLTPSSLLTAVVTTYGLNPAADSALINLLPTGKKAPLLDTSVTYYSTQLAGLLADMLADVMSEAGKLGFILFAMGGALMRYPGESIAGLEGRLSVGTQGVASTSTYEISS